MYRLGERINRKRKKRIIWSISLGILALIAVIFYFYYKVSHVKTVIHQSKGTVTVVESPNSQTLNYDEGDFSVSIPKSWQPVKIQNSLYKIYEWKTTTGDSQTLDIYEDTIPQGFAVNRELALQPEGGKLSTIGLASDNCSNFTKAGSSGMVATPARWQGINFLCDEANYERDVVGTGSTAGINTVTLNGTISGTHSFFFVYTNYSINPDFTLFYQILASFYLK